MGGLPEAKRKLWGVPAAPGDLSTRHPAPGAVQQPKVAEWNLLKKSGVQILCYLAATQVATAQRTAHGFLILAVVLG